MSFSLPLEICFVVMVEWKGVFPFIAVWLILLKGNNESHIKIEIHWKLLLDDYYVWTLNPSLHSIINVDIENRLNFHSDFFCVSKHVYLNEKYAFNISEHRSHVLHLSRTKRQPLKFFNSNRMYIYFRSDFPFSLCWICKHFWKENFFVWFK